MRAFFEGENAVKESIKSKNKEKERKYLSLKNVVVSFTLEKKEKLIVKWCNWKFVRSRVEIVLKDFPGEGTVVAWVIGRVRIKGRRMHENERKGSGCVRF